MTKNDKGYNVNAKQFWDRHKNEILFGMRILKDPKLVQTIREALDKKMYSDYKKETLYKEALDYASK